MVALSVPTQVSGLTDEEMTAFGQSMGVLMSKQSKNAQLNVYYDGKKPLEDLGISIPPALRGIEVALEWPARAVQGLAEKHRFEGFSLDGDGDPFDMGSILERNHFESELDQGINSTYKHSCSFLTVGAGGEGEPDVVIQARSADYTAAVWDKRSRSIKHAVGVVDEDETGNPTDIRLYMRGETIQIVSVSGKYVVADRFGGITGRTSIEPLVHDPQLSRPFGKSRITREVRYLTDAALRTMARAEVSAEFFTAPQRYALGLSEDSFSEARWTAIMGRIWGLGLAENGDMPEVGQLPQVSMTPHWEMYRQLAQNFAAATGLPQSQVGLFAENPASAEAMQAAEAAISDKAERQWRIFAPTLKRVLESSIRVRDGDISDDVVREIWRTRVNWTPARYVSPSSASNWAVQAVQADETLRGSSVIQRRLGLTPGEIDEVRSESARNNAPGVLDQLMGRSGDSEDGGVTEIEVAQAQKAKFDALGVAIRAGVDPVDAAARVGLDGIKFTGAVPSMLRMQESDARRLEE